MAEPTQVIQNTTTIPDYARPYVEQMLGMVGGSLYDYEVDKNGQMVYRDSAGKIVAPGTAGAQPTPTGFKAYTPYTGDRTAQFTQLQKDAYAAAGKLGYNPYSTSSATGLQSLAGQAGRYDYDPSSFNYTKVAAPTLQNFQMAEPADVAAQKISVGNIKAAQMGPAQQVRTQNFTSPGAVDQYMSPYQQAVVDIGKREAQRQADIAGTQRGARQAQAGAFGGSRSAIENAEAQRNLSQQMSDIQSKGSQEAYSQAAQMFTSDQARQLAAQQANQQAGLTVGMQNLNAQQQANVQNMANQLQASGMNAQQAMQAALANQGMDYNSALQNAQFQQQAALSNQALAGQYGLTQGQFQQAANMQNPQQALQAALANQQMGYNVGNQNLQANLGVQSLGSGQNLQAQLANQMTNQQMQQLAEQSKQYGAGLGLQGLQAGMQGYSNLANVGQNLYGQNVSNLNAQAQFGGQQQQQIQNILNQQYQDFLTQQQFPYQQASYMSNILRGVPLQQGTQSVYSAPPSFLSQVAGAGLTGYSLNNLFGTPTPKAEGGEIREERRGPSGLSALVLSKMG